MTDHIENPEARPRFGYKKGWKQAFPHPKALDIPLRLKQLTESHLTSDEVKERAREILSEIVDGRMPSPTYDAARRLIKKNKIFNKTQIMRAGAEDRVVAHAVFMACQACENLRDKVVSIHSFRERNDAILQIALAIQVLSETQSRLIGGEDDSER